MRQDIHDITRSVTKILRALSPDQVPPILAAILLYESKLGQRPPKPPLEAQDPKAGPSGTVLLVALAVAGALYYEYDWSTDQINWTLGGRLGQTRFTIAGLTPAKQYWFRVTAFMRDGTPVQPVVIGPHIVR